MPLAADGWGRFIMRAVIIGGGDFGKRQAVQITDKDFVICADSGYDSALKYNIHADAAIGDMDSVKSDINVKKLVYPSRKDFTDGELALRYALDSGYKKILMTGFTGERLDHTLADIFMLDIAAESGAEAVLIDEYNEIYYLCEKAPSVVLEDKCGETLSILPLGDLKGLYTKGMEYPVNYEDISFFASRTVSNVIASQYAEIGIKSGRTLVILSRDKGENE